MYYMKLKTRIPDWANWIAQNKDGWWYAYEREPIIGQFGNAWRTGDRYRAICEGLPPNDFTEALYKIVRGE